MGAALYLMHWGIPIVIRSIRKIKWDFPLAPTLCVGASLLYL